MARHLTDQQEIFARELVAGKTQIDAYHIAYPKSKDWNISAAYTKASILAKHDKVVERLEVLRKPVERRLQYGLQTAMEEAMEAFQVSKANKQGGAMVAAAQLRAKLNGLITERKEIAVTQMGNMTPTEKEMLLVAAQAQLDQLRKQVQLVDNSVSDVEPKPNP
ncbi:MAG: hypothetical protein CGW95_06610 [Phenylobacterium zucineum]|nr:MAG: hypothetical protein CGW95_06610 [Phenylobacterium zucineum]